MIPIRSSRFPSFLAALLALVFSFTLVPTGATQATAAKPALDLDQLVKDKSYLQLEAALKSPAAEKLSKAERDYFAGVIANRRNRLQESIGLLAPLVDVLPVPTGGSPTEIRPTADTPLTPERQKMAWRALGDSYTKLFRYPEAAAAYERAEVLRGPRDGASRQKQTTEDTDEERHELRLEREFRELMRNQPAQTVSLDSPFTVQGRRSKVGLLEIQVHVAADKRGLTQKEKVHDMTAQEHTTKDTKEHRGTAQSATDQHGSIGTGKSQDTTNGGEAEKTKKEDWWIVDTGANFSTITRSTAQRLGLKLSDGSTHVRGITGAESKLNLAIIPELRIGSAGRAQAGRRQATVRNVAVLVLDDENLYIPPVKYQIHGIIGAPVLMALERITFFADDRFGVRQPVPDANAESNMMMDELTPLVEASTYSSGQPLLFSFDTGANRSAFYARYYNERRPEFARAKRTKRQYGGAGGVKVSDAYRLEDVPMEICGGRLTLPVVDVNTEPTKKIEPEFYGNLGQDILKPFRSLTIDFTAMRCSVEQASTQ